MRSRDRFGAGRTIAIWGVPRSVSTAFEKTFTRLPGLRIVHEPFADCYYFGPTRRSSRYGSMLESGEYTESRALRSVEPSAGETLIFKDLCFQAAHYIPDEVLDELTNTFIVRHPDIVVDSLRKLKPNFTEEEFGFEPLAEMFNRVTALGQEPTVVEGQVFRRAPELVLRRYCAGVGIGFRDDMLEWDDGRIRAWAPHEAESQAKWHSTLEASEHIEPPAVEDPPSPVELGETYRRSVEIYERVAMEAITPASEAMNK